MLEESSQNKIKESFINKGKSATKKIATEGLDKAGKFFIGPLPLGGWCFLISCAWFLGACFFALIIWLAVEIGIVEGMPLGNCTKSNNSAGCYLKDEAFTDTNTITNADYILNRLKKYPKLQGQKDKVEKIVEESKKEGINPAILIAFWSGEQSFGDPEAAFGCGVYGGKNRASGFDSQINCAIKCIKKAINKESPYNKPDEANTWNRLLYNYVAAARKRLYEERGYVSSETDDPRIIILKQLAPNQVVCNTNNSNLSMQDNWLNGNNIIKKPATNPKILNSQIIQPQIIVLHYTGSTKDTAKSIWNWFNSGTEGRNAWAQFIIDQDGTIYQMSPANREAAHVTEYNKISIGIEGCGNYEIKQPSEQHYNSYLNLVKTLMSTYNIPKTNIYGHCELNSTCRSDPGKFFLNRIRKDLNIDINKPHGDNPLQDVPCK